MTGLEPTLQVELVNRYPQTLEACMREAQLDNDRNLALQFARVELGIPEPEGVGPQLRGEVIKGIKGRMSFT